MPVKTNEHIRMKLGMRFERDGTRLTEAGVQALEETVAQCVDTLRRTRNRKIVAVADCHRVALLAEDVLVTVANSMDNDPPTDETVVEAVLDFLYDNEFVLPAMQVDASVDFEMDELAVLAHDIGDMLWVEPFYDAFGDTYDIGHIMNGLFMYITGDREKAFISTDGALCWSDTDDRWLLFDEFGKLCLTLDKDDKAVPALKQMFVADRDDKDHIRFGNALRKNGYVKTVKHLRLDRKNACLKYHTIKHAVYNNDKNMCLFGKVMVTCCPLKRDVKFQQKKLRPVKRYTLALAEAVRTGDNPYWKAENLIRAMLADPGDWDTARKRDKNAVIPCVIAVCQERELTESITGELEK